jgi:hypothetical protein
MGGVKPGFFDPHGLHFSPKLPASGRYGQYMERFAAILWSDFLTNVLPRCFPQTPQNPESLVPGASRTRDLRLRRPTLYPAELRAHMR